jgi:hypothetical protein
MNQLYPETGQSPEAAEGEAAHEIGAELVGLARRGVFDTPWAAFEGRAASNGTPFDEEMFEAATVYAEDVSTEMARRGAHNPHVEERIHAPAIHELSEGTPDCWLWDEKRFELLVWDFKYGHGSVEVFENWQLINYVAGILHQLDLPAPGLADQAITVSMRVAQPRAFHRDGPIREWGAFASDLRGHFNILAVNAEKALSADPGFNPGPHCRYCPGRHACPAALQGGVQLFEAATAAVPIDLTPAALGLQLALIRRAQAQLKCLDAGYSERVQLLIRAGTDVPGWAAETKRGRERWNIPDADAIRLGSLFGLDLAKPANVVTPKQAVALGVDEAVISAYCETPTAGVCIVPDNLNKAKQVFS